MPVLFLGHGSPMNAIEDNEFVAGFREIARTIPKPSSILCISAHWETSGTRFTAMEQPRTIHDFGGFPPALYEVQYPAPGNPDLAYRLVQSLQVHQAEADQHWGLDHGAWSVINHLYPEADIPVVQMSLNYHKNPAEHFALAAELAHLRRQGVLIIGSGNIDHNLRLVDWRRLHDTFAYDWALEADYYIKAAISSGDFPPLLNWENMDASLKMAIPTAEHFLPLLYVLALKEEEESLSYFNDKPLAGALSMTSIKIT